MGGGRQEGGESRMEEVRRETKVEGEDTER